MRRMIALLLAALMLVAMTACGAKNETTDTSAPADTAATETTSTETADTSDAAESTETADPAPIPGLEDGVFTVGMECAYAPYNWTQMDDSNGAVPISNVPGSYANGYDVDDRQARSAEANGWELEIVSSAWDSLCPAVQSGTDGRQHRRPVHDR